jgi:putative hydrolase of the HAD superfamily
MQRHCLLIDAMGTLIALLQPAPRLVRELDSRLGLEVSIAQAERAIAAEIRYYRAHMNEGRDERTVAELRNRCAAELRMALPDHGRLSALDESSMTDALLASLQFQVFGDAREALRTARRHEYDVVVVSNWDSSLAHVLDRVGLSDLIDGVVTSASVGVGKPDPEIFKSALTLAGVAPLEALHVGDSLEEDVAGARAAGIDAIWLNRDRGPTPPGVPTVASLSELQF